MKTTNFGLVASFVGFIAGIVFGWLAGDNFTLSVIAGSAFGILILLWNSCDLKG